MSSSTVSSKQVGAEERSHCSGSGSCLLHWTRSVWECVNQSGGPLTGWYAELTPAPTGGRSWSSEVWTCIPALRTVFLLWGRTASLWPPRPAWLHPAPGPGPRRHRAHTAWHVGTPEGETAQRNRPSVPTWARSERSHLRKSTRSQSQQQRFAFLNPSSVTLRLDGLGPQPMLQVLHADVFSILSRVPEI